MHRCQHQTIKVQSNKFYKVTNVGAKKKENIKEKESKANSFPSIESIGGPNAA
jgi:hypothetical protein